MRGQILLIIMMMNYLGVGFLFKLFKSTLYIPPIDVVPIDLKAIKANFILSPEMVLEI